MLTELSKTYKPLRYPQAEEYRLQSEDIHWIVKEVEMTKDLEDFKSASIEEKEFISFT